MPNRMRDSKDPMPTADHSQRVGMGGNSPIPSGDAETKGSKKSEHVRPEARFILRKGGESQPTRQDGGNTPVTGEMHDQKKGQTVTGNRSGL